jgi:hypothetical protein
MIFRRFFAGSQPVAEPARAVVGTHPAGMAA